MKLSVLDQSPISRGASPEEALTNTVKLAQTTEKLGYTRFWVAEHHNTNGLASVSPEVLISHIASQTSLIRVGSGGVLLSQYSPLKVAENFKLLEALFPGRIDLGVGSSPGGSKETRMALMDGLERSMREYPRLLSDLQGFLHNSLPRDHNYRLIKATPRTENTSPLWVLGLSERGAKNAGKLGAGFTFGHFINPANGIDAMKAYRESFQPSETLKEPQTNVCIFIVCAETEKKAQEIAMSQDKWLLNVNKGADTKVPSVEEVKSRSYSPEELKIIEENRKRCVIGTPMQVKEELERLSEVYQTDEFMIITNIYDFEDKLRSYELLADEFGL